MPGSSIFCKICSADWTGYFLFTGKHPLFRKTREGDKEDSVCVIIFSIFFVLDISFIFHEVFICISSWRCWWGCQRAYNVLYIDEVVHNDTDPGHAFLANLQQETIDWSGDVAVLMQYSATWRVMARRAVFPLAFERTPSVSLSMLIFSFHWAHRDRQWRVHGCFIKFVGLRRLVKINNTQKDVFEWEYFTRGSWVCRSAYIQYCEKAERRSKLCRLWLEIPSAQKKRSHFWIVTPTPWEFQKSSYTSCF